MASLPYSPCPAQNDPPLGADPWEMKNARWLYRLALALVVVGLAWRFTRYLLRFPIWGDEAMLLVNYFTRSYLDMFGPIDHGQIAPLLFHFSEIFAFRWFGPGELAMRLPSFLACLGSVALFWRLAGLTLPPLGRLFAIGIFSVSIWPATMGSLAKPYAFDLFFSLVLLVPAVAWLARPERWASLAVLALVTPLAVASSYTSAFVGGAIGLVLLPAVWQRRSVRTAAWFALYGCLLIGTFLAHFLFVSRLHLATTYDNVDALSNMQRYWDEGFPPPVSHPFRLCKWLVLAHIGQIAAYPLGSANGGSIGTVVLSLVGAVWMWQRGQKRLVLLVGASFALWFLAGVLHRYPYGASCRLAQHAAPFYCLLAGLGGAVLVLRLPESRARWRVTLWTAGLLAAIGIGGSVRDVIRPYRDEDALWARAVAEEVMKRAGDDPVLLAQDLNRMNILFTWQFGSRGRVVSVQEIDWTRRAQRADSVWVFSDGPPVPAEKERLHSLLARSGLEWSCAEQKPSLLAQKPKEPCLHCKTYHWVRKE